MIFLMLNCKCQLTGAEWHVGVIPDLERGLYLRDFAQDSIRGIYLSLWRWEIWGEYSFHSRSSFFLSKRALFNNMIFPTAWRSDRDQRLDNQSPRRCAEKALPHELWGGSPIPSGWVSRRRLADYTPEGAATHLRRQGGTHSSFINSLFIH